MCWRPWKHIKFVSFTLRWIQRPGKKKAKKERKNNREEKWMLVCNRTTGRCFDFPYRMRFSLWMPRLY